MSHKIVLPLGAALAALLPGTANAAVQLDTAKEHINPQPQDQRVADLLFVSGEDFLSLIVTQQADGTIVAQHRSHYSHSSHSSHRSHYSSRY